MERQCVKDKIQTGNERAVAPRKSASALKEAANQGTEKQSIERMMIAGEDKAVSPRISKCTKSRSVRTS
jgi:hypothetical protein